MNSSPSSSVLSQNDIFDLSINISNVTIADRILCDQSVSFLTRRTDVVVGHVINLRRRRDRLGKIKSRSIRAGICIDLACCDLVLKKSNYDPKMFLNEKFSNQVNYFGHAYDADTKIPVSIVDKQWDPSSISNYDRFVSKRSHIVDMTSSERACAFSHVSAWMSCFAKMNSCVRNMHQLQLLCLKYISLKSHLRFFRWKTLQVYTVFL